MPFHSPLLPLLRLRSSLERMAWLRLRTIHTQIARANAELREIKAEMVATRAKTAERLRAGVASAQLAIESVRALEFEEARMKLLLDKWEQDRREAERNFLRSRRERRVVENAVALEQERYEEERARREQVAIDDGVLQRISRERQAVSADESSRADCRPNPERL